jgi:hypothetical protein
MAGAAISDMDFDKVLPIVLTFAGVTVLAILGRIAISRYRKRLMRGSQDAIGPWTLDDLRDMRESGQLTDQEYQVLRQRMIGKAMGAAGGVKAKPNPPAGPNDNRHRGDDLLPPLV